MALFWIAFIVTFIIGMIVSISKKQSKTKKVKIQKPSDNKKITDEELITVVLPTINNSK